MTTFNEKLQAKWNEGKFVCVGLDSELSKIPQSVLKQRFPVDFDDDGDFIFWFNREMVFATSDVASCYKLNLAFYVSHGDVGLRALRRSIESVREFDSDMPVILDAKSMDIGNTNLGYVQMAFEYCDADAITVNPYLGREAAQPFLDQKNKGVIVLCRTSNSGAGEFQDLRIEVQRNEAEVISGTVLPNRTYTAKLFQHVAYQVAHHWDVNDNCAVVVGATYPEELAQVRRIVGDMPILIPGIGAQGGDVEATVKAGMDSGKQGMIINSSRGIIFASSGTDFAEAAQRETQKLHDLINQYRN